MLGKTVEPALAGQIDLAFVGGTTSGDTFYGLVYSKVAKALYEYRWKEGESTVTKAFGPIPFAAVQAPMTVAGNWRYFELKPDGTAYTLMPSGGVDYDAVLSVVGPGGVREVGRVNGAANSGVFVGLPRHADGYYYAVAYVPFLAGGERAPQLDIVRIKE